VQRDAARESSGNTGNAFENLLDIAAPLSLKTKWHGEALMIRNTKKIRGAECSKVVEKEYSIARCVGGRGASLSPY
jgi:hypothetical protein